MLRLFSSKAQGTKISENHPNPVMLVFIGELLLSTLRQGLSRQGVWVSFWHPGPRKIPILEGKDTLYFGQIFLNILITSRYFKINFA